MKNTFKTSMDSYSNEITVMVTMLFIAIFVTQAIFPFGGKIISILISLFLLAIYSRAYLFRPVSYEITNDFLIIHRPANDVTIPRQNLTNAEIIDKEKMKCKTMSFGINGLFGYSGKFVNEQIGTFIMYATRKNKTVLIQTTDNKKVILTPDKPAKFIRQLII